MSVVAPAPSGSRGEVILQPNYFTSSIFVSAVRDDIATLIHSYYEQYTNSQPTQPFALFKSLWSSQGWQWMHFIVFDDRTRETFLNVVLRLFLERTVETDTPCNRAVALFGLYTFFYTQPKGTAPPLYNATHIPISSDHFACLNALPSALNVGHLQRLLPSVSFINSVLLKDNVFFITPLSDLGPLNPRDIPREIFIDEKSIPPLNPDARRKKGRPTRRDKAKKARLALDNLDKWLEDIPSPPPTLSIASSSSPSEGIPIQHHPVASSLRRYQTEKSQILKTVDAQPESSTSSLHAGTIVEKANQFVLKRLKVAEGLFSSDMPVPMGNEVSGVARVERAVREFGDAKSLGGQGGALNLLEGAGKSHA